MAEPPPDLVNQIPNEKPTEEQARRYLEIELDKVIPAPRNVVGDITLVQMLKDVTYEMLKDDEFQRKVREAYPRVVGIPANADLALETSRRSKWH